MAAESTIVFETVDSQVLRGNPLGDRPVRRVPIYLPPGYANGTERYPVVFVLTGFTGRGTMLLNDMPWDENLQRRMDRLIRTGQVEPMILVMPDCFTAYGGSQYLNSSATGRYEDHILEELVPFIDRTYRTRAEPAQRGVVGKSSGGYGSLVLAMRHPDVFGLTCSHSGDMYFEYCYKPEFTRYLNSIARFGDLESFLKSIATIRPKDKDFHAVLDIVAMSAAYSPNPDSPVGFDLPFDQQTGEIDEAVWQRWLAWDPVYMIDRYADNLRRLKLIFLDCGTRDEFNLHYGARIFAQRLVRLGIPHRHEEFDDGHMSIPYRYDVSLRALSDAFTGN